MCIFQHPGFMQYDAGTFDVLHADWPVYPAGHGWQLALRSLAVFPPNVRFRPIDDIDKCLLFVAAGTGSCLEPKGDLHDPRWFHVAVWHDDLLELHERGLISGMSLMSEYETAVAWYEQHKNTIVMNNGQLCRLDQPLRDHYDEELPTIPRIAAEGITVTDASTDILISLTRPVRDLERAIRQRVEPLLLIPFYDTAIREAGVILETRLREITGSASFGQVLIDEYYKLICSGCVDGPRAIFKVLRSELRTIFKFVRNDFAHALRDVTDGQCRVLLDRTSSILQMITRIAGE